MPEKEEREVRGVSIDLSEMDEKSILNFAKAIDLQNMSSLDNWLF